VYSRAFNDRHRLLAGCPRTIENESREPMRFTADFHLPLPVAALVKRTIAEVNDDNCLGLAAQLAFYFFLALFPALLFLVALLGYLPVDRSLAIMLSALASIAPEELLVLLRDQIAELRAGRHGTLLTFGVAGALWSSSAAMVAIIDALNRAYDVTEVRPWWKRRFLAIVLTIAMATFIVTALATVMAGPDVVTWVARAFGLSTELSWLWGLVRWPLIVLLVVLGIDLVYHFAPNLKRDWAWLTPGSVLATALWIASSFAFKLYVANFADFNATHGAIGGVIVILLWFYVSSLAILVGAELNGVIEQSPRER
jgi:membrane protein